MRACYLWHRAGHSPYVTLMAENSTQRGRLRLRMVKPFNLKQRIASEYQE